MTEETITISLKEYNELQDAYILYKLFEAGMKTAEKDAVELVELRAKYQNLLYKVEDFKDDYKKVMQEECAPDEKHCSCVPHLREMIKRISNEKFAVWKANCKDFTPSSINKLILE